jgi:hypothetical protein
MVLYMVTRVVPAGNILKHGDTKNTETASAEHRNFSVALMYEGYTEFHREDTEFHRGTHLCVLRGSVVIFMLSVYAQNHAAHSLISPVHKTVPRAV